MQRINRYISSLLLAAAIAAPTAIMAAPKPQDANVQVRVYDRDHRDYHNWDDHEDRAYRRYLQEQHRGYRKYERQHYRVQKHYWGWRHSHPDGDNNGR
jgi:Ni/Co efflux regulator RcnB